MDNRNEKNKQTCRKCYYNRNNYSCMKNQEYLDEGNSCHYYKDTEKKENKKMLDKICISEIRTKCLKAALEVDEKISLHNLPEELIEDIKNGKVEDTAEKYTALWYDKVLKKISIEELAQYGLISLIRDFEHIKIKAEKEAFKDFLKSL